MAKPTRINTPAKSAPARSARTVAKPAAPVKTAPTKVREAHSVTKGQMQGAAVTGPKKLEKSNFLFSKSFVDKAMDWKHKTFGTTRKKIHQALTKDPAFLQTKHATKRNLKRMEAGKAPLAPKSEQLGKRKAMELDHKWERRDGVKENVVGNLRLVSPLKHKMKAMRKFNTASGAKMPDDLRKVKVAPVKNGVKTL